MARFDDSSAERSRIPTSESESMHQVCRECRQIVKTTWEELDMGTGTMRFFRTRNWHMAKIGNVLQQCPGSHVVIEQI